MKKSLTLKLLCTTIATSSLIVAIPLINTSCSVNQSEDKVIPFDLLEINNEGALVGHGDISQYNKLVLPEGVTSIASQVFRDCFSIKSIDFSSFNGDIGGFAFYSCKSLESIDLSSLTSGSIGDNAFNICTSLTSVDLNCFDGNIGDSAFKGCASLTSINLSSLVNGSIGTNAFYDCPSLLYSKVIFPTSNSNYTIIDNASTGKMLYDETNNKVVGCLAVGSFVWSDLSAAIGDSIPNYAFYKCGSLTSIDLSGFSGNIGKEAFYGCVSLISIGLTTFNGNIGNSSFYGCISLTSINLSSLTIGSIDVYAFDRCSSLESIIVNWGAQPTNSYGNNCFVNTSPTGIITNLGNWSTGNVLDFFVSKGLSSTGWTVTNQ